MNPKEILDNIDNLDINDIEIPSIEITEIEKERAKINIKNTIKSREVNKTNYNNNKSKYKKYILVATLAISVLIGMSPTVRAEIKKMIFSFNNPGVESAVDNGYVQSIEDVSMSNKDMDIKLENIMIDKSKIALDFLIIFKDEQLLDKEIAQQSAQIELSDENDNVLLGLGTDGIFTDGRISGYEVILDKDPNKKNVATLKVLFSSTEATIPEMKRLKVNLHSIRLMDTHNEKIYSKDLNWSFEINVADKFKNSPTVEYSYENNNSNIKINKVEALPTGLYLEYEYFPVGHYENIVTVSKLIAEDGTIYSLGSLSSNAGDKGQEILSGVFKGISSFDNINKFTLEIPTPDNTQIDKIEFIKNNKWFS